jgi:hypothetical protein
MARSRRTIATRHAVVPAGRHRAREVVTGRYAPPLPAVRARTGRAADHAPPLLVPAGRMAPVVMPSWR